MQRLNNISLLRLIAVILILASHILLFLDKAIISDTIFPFYFGVNIFLFISAFLYAGKDIGNVREFYKKQFTKILVPALLFIVIIFSLELFIEPAIFLTIDGYNPIANLWYVIAICVCYAIIPLLKIATSFDATKAKKTKSKLAIFGVLLLELIISFFAHLQFAILNFVLSYFLVSSFHRRKTELSPKKLGFIGALITLVALGGGRRTTL